MISLTIHDLVSNMLNKLSGQPESYEKKYDYPIPFFLAPFLVLCVIIFLTLLSLDHYTSLEEPSVLARTVLFARPIPAPARSPSKSS